MGGVAPGVAVRETEAESRIGLALACANWRSRRPFTFPFCVFPRVLKFFMRTWGHLTDCMDVQTDKSPHC